MTSWIGCPATEIAAAVRSGTVTAAEVGSWPRNVVASLRFAPMTGIWNMAGFPAASMPCPPAAGLPGSVQLVAAPGGESLLLAVAAQLERARPWPRHAPVYS